MTDDFVEPDVIVIVEASPDIVIANLDIVVYQEPVTDVILMDGDTIIIEGSGLTGATGPVGPAGGGANPFNYTQPTPAATWIIPHNLGRRVQVTLFDTSFNEVETDVVQGDVNTVTATFAIPTTGSAVLI